MSAPGNVRAQRLRELAQRGDLKTFEEVWLESVETAPTEVDVFLAGADALHAQGILDKASLYMSMLAPQLLERGLYREALFVLRKMAVLNPREKGIRQGLMTVYKSLHGDHPGLAGFLEKSGLESGGELKVAIDRMEIFLGFSVGRYLFHPAGWGPGRVAAILPEESAVVIDFESRRGHRMSLEMAAKVTEFLDDLDLRALRYDRQTLLVQWVEDDPAELVRAALRSRRGKATLREIRDRLTTGLIDAKAWSKWWTKAKSKLKAASDISMTPGSNPTFELGSQARGYPQACVRELALLDGDEKRVKYLRDLLGEAANQPDGATAVASIVKALIGPSGQAPDLKTGPRFSLACLLEESRTKFPGSVPANSLTIQNAASDPASLAAALGQVPIAGHRLVALGLLKASAKDQWPKLWRELILQGEPDAADACLAELIRHGHHELARDTIRFVTDRYKEYPDAYVWYLRTVVAGKLPKDLPVEPIPTLLEKGLILHDHLAVATIREEKDDTKRAARSLVNAFQGKEYGFVRDAFDAATAPEARALAALLRNNRSLHRDTRDHMMAHMFRRRPDLGRTEGSEAHSRDQDPLLDPNILFCTEGALLRKRMEFEELVNRQIPENAAEIGRAASYGDLSENSEWSAAIEKQSRLTRLSEEMAAEMAKARIIDPTVQGGDQVTLGSRVRLQDQDGRTVEYTILGPWEVDLDRGIISYLSPIGKSLLKKSPGDRFQINVRATTNTYEVLGIEDGIAALSKTTT